MKSEPVILLCPVCDIPYECVTDMAGFRRPRCGICQAKIRKAKSDQRATEKMIKETEEALDFLGWSSFGEK